MFNNTHGVVQKELKHQEATGKRCQTKGKIICLQASSKGEAQML